MSGAWSGPFRNTPAETARRSARRRRQAALGRIAWRRRGLGVAALFIAAAVALGAAAPIRPQASAPGALVTEQEMVMLRDFAGGDVAEILVAPGEDVAAGAPILRLDGEMAAAEIERLATRRAHLALRRDRFAALLADASFQPAPDPWLRPSHVTEALRLFDAEAAEAAHADASRAAEIVEAEAEAGSARAGAAGLAAVAKAHGERLAMAERLAASGAGSRRATLEAQAELAGAEARLAELQGRGAAAASAALRLKSAGLADRARRRAAWSAAIAEAETELSDIEARLADAEARAERLVATAPIAGRVLELGAATAGDAIAPGGLVATIVPAGAEGAPELIAEIRIAPRDVGYIAEGAPVRVAVSAFDKTLFGEIEGALRSISPSTLFDRDGAPYYRGEVSLPARSAALGARQFDLAPGMTVEARIALGERSLLNYMLRPLSHSLDAAFRER
ncbi:MAG: HlyD family type I secretion periplasmic adaptor subunit [Pseudomonadota bacterium]